MWIGRGWGCWTSVFLPLVHYVTQFEAALTDCSSDSAQAHSVAFSGGDATAPGNSAVAWAHRRIC